MTVGYDNAKGTPWSAVEREMALRHRDKLTNRGVSELLRAAGFDRSPKAVQRFLSRNVPEPEEERAAEERPALIEKLPDGSLRRRSKPLLTSWGEPLCVTKKRIEFGQNSSLVPVMFVPDLHAPFQDPWAVELACRAAEIFKPLWLIYLGDCVDWVQLSKFDKDPYRLTDAYEEVKEFHRIDRDLASACTSETRRIMHLGNHELRMRKEHLRNPHLIGFPGLQFDAVLGMDEDFRILEGFQIVEQETNWRDRFVVKHGDKVRKYSCYTAKAELEDERVSGVSGHSHRLGSYATSNRGRTIQWTEAGCLCSLEPDYLKNPNWQQGIALGWFNGDGKNDYFHVETVSFSQNQAIIMGNYIRAKKTLSVV